MQNLPGTDPDPQRSNLNTCFFNPLRAQMPTKLSMLTLELVVSIFMYQTVLMSSDMVDQG